jgi:HTH-type transcriptional regulator / antitoxin HigA
MQNNPLHNIEIKPLTDEASYQKACDLIEKIMDMGEQAQPDEESKRLAYLDTLSTLAEAYEARHFTFNQTELTLVQIIEQALEQLNLTKKDLAKMLGSNRVTELFSGKRDLSMAQVRILHQQLHIPTDMLIFSKRPGQAAPN